MDNYFLKVKNYLIELEYEIVSENIDDSVFVIQKEEDGIKNLMIACDDPILIIEQYLFDVESENCDTYKKLLQINRNIVHGAFVIDESGKKIIFRDTLQLENLDINEIQGSLNSLVLLLSEYTDEMLNFSRQ
ncbi:MAG: molecular chaperone Tir [Bacteroidetes bacterium]|jgi:hypothetical protein|nr:molecular chaperone Tir [Bacteroidota bacterium]MBT6687885.1 molecular chaperone Tir [Bacteroidota bacterium]MBT7142467.1 molecular chaperone Tir [Bacteroidota bacterium]MBT7490026.1 molecular chaperone Tir [Bacteroidota bacterium]